MKRPAITPESLGYVVHLPRFDAWQRNTLPTRRGAIVLQPWVCFTDDRAMVVNYRLLNAVLRSVRKRRPIVTVTTYFVQVSYDRGLFRLALHDATAVLGRVHHHYLRQQHDLAAKLHKVAPLELNERTAS